MEDFEKKINVDSPNKEQTKTKKNSQGFSGRVRAGSAIEICEIIEEYSDECNKKINIQIDWT